jgi:hypothetical protein
VNHIFLLVPVETIKFGSTSAKVIDDVPVNSKMLIVE